jgi:hypothetical protein
LSTLGAKSEENRDDRDDMGEGPWKFTEHDFIGMNKTAPNQLTMINKSIRSEWIMPYNTKDHALINYGSC